MLPLITSIIQSRLLFKKIQQYTKFSTILSSVKSPNSIVKNIILVAILLGVAKGISLVKEIVVADKIGVSSDLDAFLIANTIMGVFGVVFSNTYSESMVPEFLKVEARQSHHINHYFSSLLWIGAIGFSFFLFLLLLTRAYYLPYFTAKLDVHTSQLTEQYLLLLTPYLVFGYFSAMFLRLLNAKKKMF